MRLIPGLILREVAGEAVLIPTGEAARKLAGIIALNPTGKFLAQALMNEIAFDELTAKMLEVYDIDEATAKQDIRDFISLLRQHKMLVEEL